VGGYVHGYATREQQRLVGQAQHWRRRLVRDGTRLGAGTRLLEFGCGVRALLAVLGHDFRRVELFGVDIEPMRRRRHSERRLPDRVASRSSSQVVVVAPGAGHTFSEATWAARFASCGAARPRDGVAWAADAGYGRAASRRGLIRFGRCGIMG
jgi:cyclopropane fatty-acyl-phospholipid synthase-like methyltransferase